MGSVFEDVFQTPSVDGIDLLPKTAGIYAMLNRITRKWNIGQSQDIRLRCQLHRAQLRAGTASNLRIRRDVEIHGADAFFFLALELVTDRTGSDLKHTLDQLETWWVWQLKAHVEQHGYVLEAGHCRTKGSRFRDRETKLMRDNSRKYHLLPGVDLYDAIDPVLLASWVPGS